MVVPSLPGMPPIQTTGVVMHSPGVSVSIQNVVGAPAPQPYAPQPYAPYPQPVAVNRAAPGVGVVEMMREDAAQRTMEAVARRGPARVLSYAVGTGALVVAIGLLLAMAFGPSGAGLLVAIVPLLAVAVAGFVVGARAGRGVASHHLEQAILRVASESDGVVRVVALARATGRPLRECQMAIDAMVSSGHANVEAEDNGALVYRIPDLEPRPRMITAHATEIVAEPHDPRRGGV